MPTLSYQLDPRIGFFIDWARENRRLAEEEHLKAYERSKEKQKTRTIVGTAVGAALTGGLLAPAIGGVAAAGAAGTFGGAAAAAVPAFSLSGALTGASLGAGIGQSIADRDYAGAIQGISEFAQIPGNIRAGASREEALAAARLGQGSQLALDIGGRQRLSAQRVQEAGLIANQRFMEEFQNEAFKKGFTYDIPPDALKRFGNDLTAINSDQALTDQDRQSAIANQWSDLRNRMTLVPRSLPTAEETEAEFRATTFVDEYGRTIGKDRSGSWREVMDAPKNATDAIKPMTPAQYNSYITSGMGDELEPGPLARDASLAEQRRYARQQHEEYLRTILPGRGFSKALGALPQFAERPLVTPPPAGPLTYRPPGPAAPVGTTLPQVGFDTAPGLGPVIEEAKAFLAGLTEAKPQPSDWTKQEQQMARQAADIIIQKIEANVQSTGSITAEERAVVEQLKELELD